MPDRFTIGDKISGKYRVGAIFPAGSMGCVLRVFCEQSGDELALKYCISSTDEDRRRFGREVAIMRQIQHPNVMTVVDANLEHDPPYFVMPIAAHSIADELEALARDEDQAMDAFMQMCVGVNAIHANGATHRDIKPHNAMRMDDDRVVVSDLGLAKLDPRASTVLTQSRQMLGTEAYMAPEQRTTRGSREADARSDVYQLGKCLYEMLTNDDPALIDLRKLNSGIASIVQKATQNHPDDRYQSVANLMDAVSLYRSAKGPDAHPSQAFDAQLAQASILMEAGQYEIPNLAALLSALTIISDNSRDYVAAFDRLDSRLYSTLAEYCRADFVRALELYLAAQREVLQAKGAYGYAEVIAEKMRNVFNVTEDVPIRVLALRITLVAAVMKWRFAAMDIFNSMLIRVTEHGAAVAVANMLMDEKARYREVAGQMPASKLHAAIQTVQATALNELNLEREARKAERGNHTGGEHQGENAF